MRMCGGQGFPAIAGLPFTITSGIDDSLSGIGKDRADIVGNPSFSGDRTKAQTLQQWFNTQAFALNALGTFGTSERNLLQGPGFAAFDFARAPFAPLSQMMFTLGRRADR